jgi:hypothetical protein
MTTKIYWIWYFISSLRSDTLTDALVNMIKQQQEKTDELRQLYHEQELLDWIFLFSFCFCLLCLRFYSTGNNNNDDNEKRIWTLYIVTLRDRRQMIRMRGQPISQLFIACPQSSLIFFLATNVERGTRKNDRKKERKKERERERKKEKRASQRRIHSISTYCRTRQAAHSRICHSMLAVVQMIFTPIQYIVY